MLWDQSVRLHGRKRKTGLTGSCRWIISNVLVYQTAYVDWHVIRRKDSIQDMYDLFGVWSNENHYLIIYCSLRVYAVNLTNNVTLGCNVRYVVRDCETWMTSLLSNVYWWPWLGQAGCKVKNSLLKLKIRNSLHLVRRDPLVDYLQKSQ